MSPIVSIIVTNYNYSNFVGQCIESCLLQNTEILYEIIVVDDGSTDDSVDIIKSYESQNVRLLKLENGGVELAANKGIKNAGGKFIVRVDADDYLLPEFLESVLPQLDSSDSVFAYANYSIVDGVGKNISEQTLPSYTAQEVLARGDFLATGTVYKKEIIEEVGCYDESLKNCGLENYQLVIKLIQAGYSGLHVASTLFSYRRHRTNISLAKRDAILVYGNTLFASLGLGPYKINANHPYMCGI